MTGSHNLYVRVRTNKTIRVDPEVFAALQDRAIPLADTPNRVLRRLLELDRETTNVEP